MTLHKNKNFANDTAAWPTSIHATFIPSAGTNVAGIYDLVEMVLVYLPYKDLTRCVQVSKFWCQCISSSAKLQRHLFKTPTELPPPEEDSNPNFDPVSIAASTAIIPVGRDVGMPIVQNSQSVLKEFLEQVTTKSLCTDCGIIAHRKYLRHMLDIRCACQSLRLPRLRDGWPIDLGQIYCHQCKGFHAHIRHDHVHPVFQFLINVYTCWKGSGASIYICIYLIPSFKQLMTCSEQYFNNFKLHAYGLKDVMDALESGKIQDDLFAAPIVKNLVLRMGPFAFGLGDRQEFDFVRNETGLTLKTVLEALIINFHKNLLEIRQEVQSWPEIGQQFIELANEIDELMHSVKAWS